MLHLYNYDEKQLEEILNSITMLYDTREKNNSHILEAWDKYKINYRKQKLDWGDYSCFIPKNENLNIPRDLYFDRELVVERKAHLEELSGNFTKRDVFEKEICTFKGRMFLLIENGTYGDICEGNYKTDYNKKSYLATLHTFVHRYKIEPIFLSNNKYSSLFIYNLMKYYIREIVK